MPPDIYEDRPWLKFYEKGVNQTVDYKDLLISQYIENAVNTFPERTALIFEGFSLTYRELYDMVGRFTAALKSFGIRKGDSVAILLPNMIPCVVAYHAILRLGGIVVMNNPLYSDRELLHQFNDSGAKLLVTLDLLADRMVKLREKTKIQTIVYTSMGDYLPLFKRLLFPLVAQKRRLAAPVKSAPDLYRFKEVLERHSPDFTPAAVAMDDVAMYQYTGGTTGVSKGVMLTHRNISCQIQQIESWFPEFSKGREIMLGALPIFHVFGMATSMNLALHMGWTNVLVPKPQAGSLLEAISKFRVTFAPMVPTMFIGILEHPDTEHTDLTSLKACFSGSAPLPVNVIRQFQEKTGSVIVEGYGLTETTPVTHVNPLNGRQKAGSIGVPFPDTFCRIVDIKNKTRIMDVGKPGALLIKGPQVMKGYLNQDEETRKVMTEDGYLYTGDVARMDEDGYFYIVDRIKDMIISSGYNIYPRDIDEVLFEHSKNQGSLLHRHSPPQKGRGGQGLCHPEGRGDHDKTGGH